MQDQEVRPEIWIEKDALSRILHRIAFDYCVPVVVAKGYASTSFKNECRERVLRNNRNEQKTIILYFGDFDPSGMNMLPTMMKTLQEDMNLGDSVEAIRVALNLEQIDQYQLPKNPDAVKPKDTRAKKFREEFGDVAVALDALHPEILETLVKDSIESVLDLSRFEEQRRIQAQDREKNSTIKKRINEMIAGVL